MKFVDSDISDLKSMIDYIELAEKDTEKKKKKKKIAEKGKQNFQTLITQCVAMNQKSWVKKEDKEV